MSRSKEQRICLGDQIEIVVIEVKGGTVRLGINAPASVRISRGEVRQKTMALNRMAAVHQAVDARDAEEFYADAASALKPAASTADNSNGSDHSPAGMEAGAKQQT